MTLPILDGNGEATAIASDYGAGVHTPHHKVTELPGTVAADITATKTATEAASTKLDTLATSLTTLQGFVDGLEALIGSTNTKVDATTAALATLQTLVDGLETLITTTNAVLNTIDGHVDGLESLITTVTTTLSTLDGHVDGLEGFTDGIEGKLDTLHTDLATTLHADIATTLGALLTTLAGAVSGGRMQSDVVTLPAPNSAGPFMGQNTVGTTPAAIGSTQALKHGVWIRNLHATQNLDFGSSSLSTSNGYRLRPGEEKFVPVGNIAQLYVVGSGASTSYCYSGS